MATPPPVFAPRQAAPKDPTEYSSSQWDYAMGLNSPGLPFTRPVVFEVTGFDLSTLALDGAGNRGAVMGSSPNVGVAGGWYTGFPVVQFAANMSAGPSSIVFNCNVVIRDATKEPSPTLAESVAASNVVNIGQLSPASFPTRMSDAFSGSSQPYFEDNMFGDVPTSSTDGYGNTWALGDVIAFDYVAYAASTTAWAGTMTFQSGISFTVVRYS